MANRQTGDSLNDRTVLKQCIPGCVAVKATSCGHYVVGLAVQVGPMSANLAISRLPSCNCSAHDDCVARWRRMAHEQFSLPSQKKELSQSRLSDLKLAPYTELRSSQ